MTTTPALTCTLDEDTAAVLIEALETHAAHLDQQACEHLFAPTAAARTQLHAEAARVAQLRQTVEDDQAAGTVTVPLDPETYGRLSAALASYHADQMHEAAEATQQRDDPDDGDDARRAAATADRLHVAAIEAIQRSTEGARA